MPAETAEPMLTTTQRLTDQESEILRSWLSGNEIVAIAKAKRLDGRLVAATIDGLCNYSRDTARHCLDTGVRQHMPAPPAPPATAARPVPDRFVSPPPPPPADELVPEAEPEPEAIPTPDPEPLGGQAEPPTHVGSVDELLAEADQMDLARVRVAAGRVRAAVDDLAVIVHQAREEDRIRALIADRRRALDEAHEQLRQLTGKPAARAHSRRPQAEVPS